MIFGVGFGGIVVIIVLLLLVGTFKILVGVTGNIPDAITSPLIRRRLPASVTFLQLYAPLQFHLRPAAAGQQLCVTVASRNGLRRPARQRAFRHGCS